MSSNETFTNDSITTSLSETTTTTLAQTITTTLAQTITTTLKTTLPKKTNEGDAILGIIVILSITAIFVIAVSAIYYYRRWWMLRKKYNNTAARFVTGNSTGTEPGNNTRTGPSTSGSVNFTNGYDQQSAPQKPNTNNAFNFLDTNERRNNLTSVENNNNYFRFSDFTEIDK